MVSGEVKYIPKEEDFSNHVQTNVNVERGIIWGISVHTVHKGILFYFIKNFEMMLDV